MPDGYGREVELRHLRYFVAVAEAATFTGAARVLRVAQPALSRQVRLLEEELGVALLLRDRRGVRLTPAGESFLVEARAILDRSQRAVKAAQAGSTAPAVEFHVGYVWGLFHSSVPPLLARFRAAQPGVAVHLLDWTATQQADALREGRLDAGFIGFAEEADDAGLARRSVGRCAIQAVLPENHPGAQRRRVRLASLARESFLVISERNYPGAARLALDACSRAGFRPRILQTADRGHALLGLVAGRCGVALLPEPLSLLPHPGVVFRPLVEQPETDLFVAWNAARSSAVRDRFLDSMPI